jgi:hypothetical protein
VDAVHIVRGTDIVDSTLARLGGLIKEADPDLTEEWKWRVTH